ncbi:MAG: hypothetical protein GC179_09005 [Anaerolineaceae bacterium]|nr:hypothetical protein [Anaerolineaceae bacterium]
MFGRVLKFGCLVVLGTIFSTGCLLSSSIEQHMAAEYEQKSASVQAEAEANNPNPAKQQALLAGIIEANKQEASRYNLLLLGLVVVVLGSSALVISTVTLFFNTRYLRPIEDQYEKAKAEGQMWRKNSQAQSPFANSAPKGNSNDDVTLPHRPKVTNAAQTANRNQSTQPHCERLNKRYKVNDKWTL